MSQKSKAYDKSEHLGLLSSISYAHQRNSEGKPKLFMSESVGDFESIPM